MRLKFEQLTELMNKANIHGISVATLEKGIVAAKTLGVSECALYQTEEPPLKDGLSQFDGSRYFLTPKGGFYFDSSTKQLDDLNLDEEQLRKLNEYFANDKTYIQRQHISVLSREMLDKITQITQHQHHSCIIEANTQFRAASLSKPLFSYLVLKLISENETNKAKLGLANLNLQTPLYEILPGFSEGGEHAKKITVGMVLSHRTGVSNSSQENDVPEVLFEPGSEFGYAGFPLLYLQMALEKQTGRSLQSLAQEYVFTPCHMNNSDFLIPGRFFNLHDFVTITGISNEHISLWVHEGLLEPFLPPHADEPLYSVEMIEQAQRILKLKEEPSITLTEIKERLKVNNLPLFPIDTKKCSSIAANSLRTTAKDYATFMKAWMNDERLSHHLSRPVISMCKDRWAKAVGLSDEFLAHISWGYGIGLQHDSTRQVNAVFHYGDMDQWRAIVVMNPYDKTGVVFFANSPNGIILAEEMTKELIDAKYALEFIRDKFSFSISLEDNWEEKQEMRDHRIRLYLMGTNVDAAQKNFLDVRQKLDEARRALHLLSMPEGGNSKAFTEYQLRRLELVTAVEQFEQRLATAEKRLKNAQDRLFEEVESARSLELDEHFTLTLSEDKHVPEQEFLEEGHSSRQGKEKSQVFRELMQQLKEEQSSINEHELAHESPQTHTSSSLF